MFLSNASIRRPVAMCCLIIGLTLLGLNAYRKMGLELLPKMDVPYVTVVTIYPGASPLDVEVDVAKKIEDAVTSVDGLKHVTSTCMENVVQTLLEFHLGTDVNVAATDVREKIDEVISDFPSGVEKPVVMKFDVNATPILTMALTGDVPLDELYDYADNTLKDRLSVVPGVAELELIGGADLEVQVLLDRDALIAAGLTSLHVVKALNQGVRTIPSGRIKNKGTEYGVRFDAEYSSVGNIGGLQIAGKDGARRYLEDLGTVVMGSEEKRQAAFVDGRPCIGIRLVKKADANAVEVVEGAKKAVAKIRKTLPGGMELVWITDFGAFIQASVDNTSRNIMLGILLTAVILFLFLFNVRSTFVVAITMPTTVVISLFFLQLFGFSLNNSTLLAIGLSVGVIVTNAIVVMESIVAHFQAAKDARKAARDGTAAVAVAVMASAGTNIVVLFPIGLMGSLVGLFFRPFAWTVLTVNAVSLFVSFTLTPILCAVLIKATGREGSILARLAEAETALLGRIAGSFLGFLGFFSRKKWAGVLVIVATILTFTQALSLTKSIGFNFAPSQDRGEIFVKLEFPTRQNLEHTVTRTREVENLLKNLPDLKHVYTSVGKVEGMIGQSSEGVYLAQILLKFNDKTERQKGVIAMLDDIRDRLKNTPGCIVTASIPSLIGGQSTPVEMEIAGEKIPVLEDSARKVLKIAQGIDGFEGPDLSVRAGKPELRIRPNRAILADLGFASTDLGMMMRTNLEGVKAAVFRRGDRTYDIRVKLSARSGVAQIGEFQTPTGAGKTTLLSGLAEVEEREVPIQITRSDKRRVVKFYSNLGPVLPLGTAVRKMSDAILTQHLLPPGYDFVFRGDYERMQDSGTEFGEAGVLAILLTYLVLAAILESFAQPFLILITLPLGLIGMLWALFIAQTSINIFVLLGGVMLVGIVVNNAVLILGDLRVNLDQGMSPHQAMLRAVAAEFRPIIMITLAAILGMLPLAISKGLGSEMGQGIGIASVGGIAVSAILTLLVIPVAWFLLTRKDQAAKNEK